MIDLNCFFLSNQNGFVRTRGMKVIFGGSEERMTYAVIVRTYVRTFDVVQVQLQAQGDVSILLLSFEKMDGTCTVYDIC
jgi:hypothetical protein